MQGKKSTFLPGILLMTLALVPGLDAREALIASLESVIGTAPDPSEALRNRSRETFYSVVNSAENPELDELIQQQQRGFVLTEEELELMKEYQMGGNVAGSNSAMRRIYPPVLTWTEKNIKVTSGERYLFINCTPRADGPFPTALVLDPEIAQQFVVGIDEYNRVVRRMPVEAELPWPEPYRGRYITHSPLGNKLLSHAVSVIIPIRGALEKANEIALDDWKSVLDYYTDKKALDSESLFLVATKEFANLAIRLAGAYPFKGLILEEPEQSLSGTEFPSDTGDAVQMMALQETYKVKLEKLECPILLFRHRNNPAIAMNDALILKPLMEWGRPLFMSMTDVPFRSISEEELEKNESDPRFLYDTVATNKLGERMLYFIQQNGEQVLNLLPEESTEPRSQNRTTSLLNQFDQMTRRLENLTDQYTDDPLSGESEGGFSDPGFDFGSSTGDYIEN